MISLRGTYADHCNWPLPDTELQYVCRVRHYKDLYYSMVGEPVNIKDGDVLLACGKATWFALYRAAGEVAQGRLVRLAGYRVTINGSPAEIIDNTVRWHRAIGYFEFAENHGGQWSKDGLTWWIDGKTIQFSEPNRD